MTFNKKLKYSTLYIINYRASYRASYRANSVVLPKASLDQERLKLSGSSFAILY